jgi:predicted ester cyclase
MNDEVLFIKTIEDLHSLINSNDEYDVLRASALIRQLFFDGGNSLVDRINRNNNKCILEFEVIEHTRPDIPGLKFNIWGVVDGIDPRAAPPHFPRIKKNRNSFFHMIDDHEYSIHDLVMFVAHVMGGVHSGSSRNEKEKSLAKLEELYIFSKVSMALQFIRAIGRIILESLKPLQYKILGLDRFDDKPGLSIHFALTLFHLPDKENFIFDVGTEESRNRASIFLDYNGELCIRFFDNNRTRYLIKAGSADFAYRYGVPAYLCFQIAYTETEILLSIEAGGWNHVYITNNIASQESFKEFHFVIGSNIFGKAETNMALFEQCVYTTIPKADGLAKIKEYFERRIDTGYTASVLFEGNKFLHSQHHPNFPEINGTDATS